MRQYEQAMWLRIIVDGLTLIGFFGFLYACLVIGTAWGL